MTLAVSIQIRGDASSLKAEATQATQGVKVLGAAAAETGRAVDAMANQTRQAAGALDAYGLAGMRSAQQLRTQAEATATAGRAQADAVQRYRDSLDPLAAAQRRAAGEMATLQGWLAKGLVNQGEYDQGVKRINTGLAEMGKAAGTSAGQMAMARRTVVMNLMDMGQAAAASGGDLRMMAAIAPDMFYGFSLMGKGALAAALGITAIGGAVAATAGAYIMHAESIKELDRALKASNDNVGKSRSELERMAVAMTAGGAVSVREARVIEGALVRMGTVGGDNFRKLTEVSTDWARLTGNDVAAAATDLAKALDDPVQAAHELDRQYALLTAGQLRAIEAMDRAGKKEEVQAALLEAIGIRAAAAADDVGLFTRALNAMSDVADGLGSALGKLGSGIADVLSFGSKKSDDPAEMLARARQAMMAATAKYGADSREAKVAGADFRYWSIQTNLAAEAPRQKTENARTEKAIKAGNSLADQLEPGLDQRYLLEKQSSTLIAAATAAAQRGDVEAAARFSALYAGVARGLATYQTEGQKALKLSQAQAAAIGIESSARAVQLAQQTKAIELMGSSLPPEEQELQIHAAGAQALAQQALARQQSIEKMTLEAAAAERLAAALGGGGAAQDKAELDNMLAAEAAQNGAARLDELAAAYARVQAAKRDQQATQLLQGLSDEYQAASLLADAQGKGAAATAAATIEAERAKLVAQGYSEEVIQTALAVMRLTQAEKVRGQLAAMDRDYGRQIEQLNTELRLVGATVEQREYELTLLEMRRKLEDAGVEDVEKELQARRQVAAAIASKKAELEKAQEAAREWARIWEHGAEKIQDALAGAFKGALTGGVNNFTDFRRTVTDLMKEMAAQIAAMLVFRPIIGGVVNLLGLGGLVSGGGGLGGILGGGGATGAAGGAGGASGLYTPGLGDGFSLGHALAGGSGSSLFGTAGSMSGLLFGNAGDPLVTGLSGQGLLGSAGTLFGSTLLADSFLPGLGALAGGLISGNVGQGVGGLGGALAGAAIGGPIGAIIGAIGGSFLGSLFGMGGDYPDSIQTQTGYQTSVEQAIGAGNKIATPPNLMGSQDWNYWDPTGPMPGWVDGWSWRTSTVAGGTAGPVQDTQARALSLVSNLGYLYGADLSGQNIGTVAKDGKLMLVNRRTDMAADQWSNSTLAPGMTAYSFDPSKQEEIDDAVARISVVMLARAASVADANLKTAAQHIDTTLDAKSINELLDFAANFNDALATMAGGTADYSNAVGVQTRKEVAATVAAIQDFMTKTAELGLNTTAAAAATKSAVEVMLGLKDAAPELSDTAKALQALEAKFSNIQPLLDMVGITADPAALKAQAMTNLTAGFDGAVADQITALTDNAALLRKAEDERYQQQLADAKLVNANLEQVERLHQIKLRQIDEQANQAQVQAAQQALATIKSTLAELTYGNLTTLSAEDRLTLARGEFTAARTKALGGDADALSQISEVVKRFLESSREVNASGAGYQTDYTAATDLLKHLAGVPGYADGGVSTGPQLAWVSEGRWRHEAHVPLPDGRSIPVNLRTAVQGSNGDVVAAIDRAAQQSAADAAALRREVTALRRENEDLRGRIDRVVSGMAAAGGRGR
jgi:hypothetical protein